ncbi:hypothetical protein GKO28_17925 [Deefgea sp. CFH1-16]|nr:hypothetical protein [Deefgea sp. CFH1-16]
MCLFTQLGWVAFLLAAIGSTYISGVILFASAMGYGFKSRWSSLIVIALVIAMWWAVFKTAPFNVDLTLRLNT